jgi:hypothetical protein
MTVRCDNCGTAVSDRYVRVAVPPELDAPRVCPHCPDRVRGPDGRARLARSHRGDGGGVATHQEAREGLSDD